MALPLTRREQATETHLFVGGSMDGKVFRFPGDDSLNVIDVPYYFRMEATVEPPFRDEVKPMYETYYKRQIFIGAETPGETCWYNFWLIKDMTPAEGIQRLFQCYKPEPEK